MLLDDAEVIADTATILRGELRPVPYAKWPKHNESCKPA